MAMHLTIAITVYKIGNSSSKRVISHDKAMQCSSSDIKGIHDIYYSPIKKIERA